MGQTKNQKKAGGSSAVSTLTTGNLKKQMLLFALPMLLGNLLQQLYNVIDAIVAGRLVDSNALSAIGVAIPIYFLMISAIWGIAMGVLILLSQFYGARQFEQVKRLFSTMLIFFSVFVVIIGVLGAVFAKPMLRIIKTPEEIVGQSALYLQILFLGVPFTMLYNLVGAAMRSLGDTKEPLYALLLSTALNLVLNLLFVSAGLGVMGIAAATILAQAVSGIYIWKRMRTKFPILALKKQDYIFDRNLFLTTLKICIPMVIQQAAIFFSLIVIQGVINQFGSEQIAGMTAATRIEAFILIPVQTMGNAVTIFVGQNIGAGQMERLKKGVRFSMIISMGVIIGLSVCMLLFGESIVSLITGTNVKAMESGNTYFSICAWFYPLTAIMYCLSGMLEGAGDTLIAAVYSAASICTRLVVALVLAPTLGFLSIAISSCFGWGIAVIIICARYFKGTWKSKSLVQTQECQVIPPSNQD